MPDETTALIQGKTVIQGKLTNVKPINTDNGQIYENMIVTPAPSEFEHPRTFPVMSRQSLGALKEIVTVQCEIQSRRFQKYLNISLWAIEPEGAH